MPNGGSDCCGSCWLFNRNSDDPKIRGSEKERLSFCTIRDLEIPGPVYTYCVNHQLHSRIKIDVPLGPVSIDTWGREHWVSTLVIEEDRPKLLKFFEKMVVENEVKRSSSFTDGEVYRLLEAMRQLGGLREKKAINGLRKIIKFNYFFDRKDAPVRADLEDWMRDFDKYDSGRNSKIILGQAIESLLVVSNGELLVEVESFIDFGLDPSKEYRYYEKDPYAAVRNHLVRGLDHSQSEKAKELLKVAVNDPNKEVSTSAVEILKQKQNR